LGSLVNQVVYKVITKIVSSSALLAGLRWFDQLNALWLSQKAADIKSAFFCLAGELAHFIWAGGARTDDVCGGQAQQASMNTSVVQG
jgi:hypothetical protein